MTMSGTGTRPHRRAALAVLILIAVGGLALTAFSGMRLARHFRAPPPMPRETDVSQIQSWMTIPYIARRYRVPSNELFSALGLPAEQYRDSSLATIAGASGRDSTEVIAQVQQTVIASQAAHPAPPGPPPRPPGAPTPVRPERGGP